MKLNIRTINNSTKNLSSILIDTDSWFEAKGIELDFTYPIPQILLTIKDTQYNGGSAGALGGNHRDENNGWYPVSLELGERYNGNLDYGDPTEILKHEILHCLYFQFGFGDIHDFGWGVKDNDKVLDHFIKNAKIYELYKVIIHHSASTTWTYKDVLNYHITKWGDIGYSFFIEKDGTIKQGRWLGNETYQCVGQNFNSIGICLAGHFNEEKPTNEQLTSLKKLLKEINLPVYFHRDFAQTECPGANFTMKLLEDDMYELIKLEGTGDVYAVKNGIKNLIINKYTFEQGTKDGTWGTWLDIKEIKQNEFDNYILGDVLVRVKNE
jgi:hypothetical protein